MRTLFGLTFLAATASLAGCGASLRDDRFATGSSTVAMARDHVTAAAVNVDEGTVSFADLVTGEVVEVEVGAEPTRIARVGDAFWVTLRGERAIAVVERAEKGWRRTAKLRAGVEPHGIVASEDGRFVYVASTQTDEVFEFDGKSREKLRTFAVGDQPRFLALHPSGRTLYVGSTRGAGISVVDLDEGDVTGLEFPETSRNTPDGPVTLDPRTTGDLAVTPDGTQLGIPVLYADTDTTVDTPEDPEQPVVDGYGSATGVGVGRLNPTLVTVPLDPDGAPADDPIAVQLAASAFSDRSGGQGVFRSYATSATASPDSELWYVTMEASNVVLALGTSTPRAGDDPGGETVMVDAATASTGAPREGGMPFTDPAEGGFVVRPIALVDTAPGPKAVVFDQEDQAIVHAWLDHELGAVPVGEARDLLDQLAEDPFSSRILAADRMVDLGASALPPDVEAGRRMFFSAVDNRMAGAGAGVSCSTCHFEGRNDGFTWTLQGEPRNTPSLAGPVNQTAPVTWSDEVDSVRTEAMLTAGLRMGGDGLSAADAALVDAYVNFTAYPDVKRRGEDSALVRLGREVFARADVGCASCHSGDFYTDDRTHLVPGLGSLPTQTPTLRGIAASAPYFHDGSAATLATVVEKSRDGGMGDTSALTAEERAALVAFLESL